MKRDLISSGKIILIFIGLLIVVFLAYRYIAPFGKIVYYRFTSKMPGAQEATTFSPGKDNILKIPAQIITTSKAKLELKLLSPNIESIKAVLKFKPTVNEIKLGIRGKEGDNFFYQPLYRDLLWYLNWEKVEEGGFTLWQKEKKYQNLYDFVNNPPQDRKIAFYFADLEKLQTLKSDKSQEEAKTMIETPLRGSHSLLIRLDKKPLVLKVAKQDMNSYEGEDKLKIAVLKGENKLIEKIIEDDGIAEASRLKTEQQEETIILENAEPGTYQIDCISEGKGSDSLITKIEVNQSKVVFKNRILFLRDKPTIIWTNVKKINAVTAHETGIQTIKLDDKYNLEIKKDSETYSFDLEALAGKKEADKPYKLESPKNDLTIEGGGYFSFSSDAFFLPEVIKAIDLSSDSTTLTNLEDIDYVVTTYLSPKKEGDWLVAEVSFDPKDIKIENDKLYFSLEVPQIAKYGGELEIDYLEIEVKSKGALAKVEGVKKAEEKEKPEEKMDIFSKVIRVFVNLYNKIFHSSAGPGQAETSIEKPIVISSFTPTPSSSPSPTTTSTPTPTTTVEKVSTSVKVLNGGAEIGTAGRFASTLREAGFSHVLADNADKSDYKNATIRYRKENKKEVDKIVELLKREYETVGQNEMATTSAEIVVILGAK